MTTVKYYQAQINTQCLTEVIYYFIIGDKLIGIRSCDANELNYSK